MKSEEEDKSEFMESIARAVGGKSENGIAHLPKSMGTGYVKGVMINAKLRLLVRQYELKKDWAVNRGIGKDEKEIVMISFHNSYHPKGNIRNRLAQPSADVNLLPSVVVATSGLDYELIPANKKMNSIIITVHADYLRELLKPQKGNMLLQMITSGNQPLLFEEIISPRIKDVAAEIVEAKVANELHDLYCKIKTEELIYLLFAELLKRQETTVQPLNMADLKRVYEVKDKILASIGTPPILGELIRLSGMSESKLKRLFKQVFGNSIYNYYQIFRIKEAEYLLREEKLSVSEVGYRLGFTNMSHFAKVFERHAGMKPKKWSMTT